MFVLPESHAVGSTWLPVDLRIHRRCNQGPADEVLDQLDGRDAAVQTQADPTREALAAHIKHVSWSRVAIGIYVLVFRSAGVNTHTCVFISLWIVHAATV